MRRLSVITSCLFTLSGCATTSFAPPQVDLVDRLEERHRQHRFWGICTPSHAVDLGKERIPENFKPIGDEVDGALALINNFIYTYRCERDRAADGRQMFELPAFLGTAAAGTAAALGAGPTVAIVAGAGAATLDHTKQYFDPQQKAQVFNDAVQAMLCIQSEAVGVNPYVLKKVSEAQAAQNATIAAQQTETNKNLQLKGITPPENPAFVSVTYGKQYFELIRTALFSVEQAVAQRLSTTGKPFPTKGVFAEYEKLAKQQADEAAANKDVSPTEAADKATTPKGKEEATKNAVDDAAQAQTDKGAPIIKAATIGGTSTAQQVVGNLGPQAVGRSIIKLNELNTKLQICVLNAQL